MTGYSLATMTSASIEFVNATAGLQAFSCPTRPSVVKGQMGAGPQVSVSFAGDTQPEVVATDGDVDILMSRFLFIVKHRASGFVAVGMVPVGQFASIARSIGDIGCTMNTRKWTLKIRDGKMMIVAEDVVQRAGLW